MHAGNTTESVGEMTMLSAQENKAFKYQPLTEPDAFRLILLQPASSLTAQVKCTLVHSTLSVCDQEIIDHYTALSYVWGDAHQTRQIFVDGNPMTITATLEAALRDLRDSSRVLRVWADALCIDQSNIEERNQQVRQMGRIYSTAHHTVIYLGLLTPPVEKILQVTPSRSSSIWTNLDAGALADVVQAAEDNLLNRPWYSRVWVFQELVLSRDPWVQCGGIRVRWADFCDLLLSSNSKRHGLKVLTEMHFARERRMQTDLFHLLSSRRGLGATDSRDMIFAHLGLASDSSVLGESISIDYKQSVEKLYEDIARYLVDTIGPETLFSQVDNAIDNPYRKNLASWAPDWSFLPSSLEAMYRDNRMNVVSLKPKVHYKFIREPRVLAHIGYEVDVISSVSLPIFRNSQQDSANRKRYQKAVDDLHALYASLGGAYASGDENGQYTRMPLENHRREHQDLYLRISSEWLHIMNEELPLLSPSATSKELESHATFGKEFESWLMLRAAQGVIAIGGDSEGMESLMYYHLHPNAPPSVLNGRRLACMKSGRVGVVPFRAHEGDVVVYLAGIPISFVLRPRILATLENVNKKIYAAFWESREEIMDSKSAYRKAFMDLIQVKAGAIEHMALVGECYVEGVIGWSFKDRDGRHDFNIYALH